MRPKFLPGDLVTIDDSFYKGRKAPRYETQRRYIVTGYSDDQLRVRNPVVTLKSRGRSGKVVYETFHQDWLYLLRAVDRGPGVE